MSNDWVSAIITGGFGAAIGGIGTAIVQSISSRKTERAEAADRVTNAAGNLADRLDREIARRDKEIARMRVALNALVEAIEDMLPSVHDEDVQAKTREALSAARVAFR